MVEGLEASLEEAEALKRNHNDDDNVNDEHEYNTDNLNMIVNYYDANSVMHDDNEKVKNAKSL